MRHIFDQYDQQENKLTHSLIASLVQDDFLLREFIKWAVGKTIPRNIKIHILEQGVPDQENLTEEMAERKGLPDAWFYTDDGWCLLVESKVESNFNPGQITRHRHTAALKGFKNPQILIIVLNQFVFDGATVLAWRNIYSWGKERSKRSAWAGIFTDYFEIVEAKMVQEGYLKKGTITKFSGIPFSVESPYTYLQAKRLLKLIIDEIKEDKSLMHEVGIDPELVGRSAITGVDGLYVWDFLRLKASHKAKNHTEFPHITFSIHNEFANVAITVPNGTNSEIRNRLFDLSYTDFEEIFKRFLKTSSSILKMDKNIKPFVNVMQRHYFTQRSIPVTDARIIFDLRTAFPDIKGDEKYQPQWLRVIYDVMKNRRSNLQMQVGFQIDYPNEKEASIISSSEGIKFFKLGIKNLGVVLRVLLKNE